jgi:hypothetical protein
VNAARPDPPTPGARAAGRIAQRREREREAHAKEQRIRRRERLEQYNEEYRLSEQQGLSPPLAPVNSSSDEEEESDGGQATSDRWNPPPPLPQAEEAAVELVPAAGTEAPAVGPSMEAAANATKVPPSPRGRGSGDFPT